MRRKGVSWIAAAGVAAAVMMVVASSAAEPSPSVAVLRQAVFCPPFKGPAELAELYHSHLVAMLQKAENVEYLEGLRMRLRAPEFSYRIEGEVVVDEEEQAFVTVVLIDTARKEQIASYVAPASSEPSTLEAWKRTLQQEIQRRASKLPFECRIRRKMGQNSYSLDRGLGSGLQPGMVLHVALDEEPLLSPVTGEVVGRDSPRAVGQIKVFRVMERTAYARPLGGTQLPRSRKLYARTF
ncbi:MAG: hypothetical protein PHO14_07620 [Kiritimatiellae bacterium]|nr:hypothetical protein [Kiritimatiellia bacterium]MDD4342088.1 hypothetical protein [Kiritimatiellia bacterium]